MQKLLVGNGMRILCALAIVAALALGIMDPASAALGAGVIMIGDTSMEEVKTILTAQGTAWEEFKKTYDELLKAKAEGKAVSDLEAKVAKIGAHLDKLGEMKTELDAAIEKMQRPGAGEQKAEAEFAEEVKSFNISLRADLQAKGRVAPEFSREQYEQYKNGFFKVVRTGNMESLTADERKAMIAGTDPDGGYLLPPSTVGRMVVKLFEQSIMRQIATVQPISTAALEGIIDNNEADAGWVGEVGSRAETNTPQVGKYRIEAFEMYAAPRVSQTLIDDAAIDVEGWLAAKVADKFGRVEGTAFWTGTGVGQARGLTTYTTVATADGTRAWGQFELVKSGANGDFHTTQFDPVHSLMGAMKDRYLQNAQFVMRREVRTKARLLKESTTNRYLWEPGMQVGAPERLMGYPVRVDQYMPTLATGSLSLAFGDFREAYTIVDRMGVRMLRDPYTAKPYIIFYSTKRTGGGAVNFEAVKFLQFSS
jgi:HK97 family phage major capsid protein